MINSIYDKKRIDRLNEKNLVLETHYANNCVISSDGLRIDNVGNKPILEKRYFKNNKCIYVDKKFNSKILHTVNTYKNGDDKIKCPNCGNVDKVSNMIDNCPYCGTDFNFGINNINSSKKTIENKLINPAILLIGGVIFFVASFFIKSGIVNNVIDKILYFIVGCIVLLPFSIILNLIIDALSKKKYNYKEIIDGTFDKDWLSKYDRYTFYNDLYKALLVFLYSKHDLIDFDIVSVKDICFNNENIDILVKVKEVYYDNKIRVKYNNIKLYMQYNEIDIVKDNYKVIKCPNCNSNISIGDKKCKFCDTININREKWVVINIEY